MSFLRLLPLLLITPGCSILFDSSDMAGPLDGGIIDAASDDGSVPYSLSAVWQSPTDTVTGQVALGPNQRPAFAGHFAGEATVAGTKYVSNGELDIMLLRFDPATGMPDTPQQYGSLASEFVTSLSIGANNDLVIAGGILGVNATLGGTNYEGAGQSVPTGLLARYGGALEHVWSLFFDSNANNSSVRGLSASGPIFVCGSYAGVLNIPETGPTMPQLPGLSGLAAFYGEYNADGSFTGGQLPFSGQGDERCELVVNDSLGSAYIAGSYSQTIDFSQTLNYDADAGLPPAAVTTHSQFIGRIDHDTTLQWAVSIPGSKLALPMMHGALGKGNQLVLVSQIEGTVTVPDLNTILVSENDEDIALFVVSPIDGEILVARSFPSLGTEKANGVSVGPNGEIALIGRFTGTIDFGGGDLQSKGDGDVFIAVFDSLGGHLWSKGFGTSTLDQGLSAAFDENGALYVTVRHQNGIDFGLGPLSGENSGALIKFEQ